MLTPVKLRLLDQLKHDLYRTEASAIDAHYSQQSGTALWLGCNKPHRSNRKTRKTAGTAENPARLHKTCDI